MTVKCTHAGSTPATSTHSFHNGKQSRPVVSTRANFYQKKLKTTITMNNYPELSEQGKAKTQVIINRFRDQLQEVVNETLFSFTSNISEEIVNDDSWIELRMKTLEALCGYGETDRHNKQDGTYWGQWWVRIREKILEENREAIVEDIIKDKEAEIKRLNERIETIQKDKMYF